MWPARKWRWLLLAGLVALVAAGSPLADEDSLGDLANSLRSVFGGVGSIRWQYGPVLLAVAIAHYGCAALALRAAAGARLPMPATTLAQLAASSANRLTPAGLGGAAVNVRFLTRAGTDPSRAIGSVAALGVLGAVADALLTALVVLCGSWIGLAGGSTELSSLGHRLSHVLTPPRLSASTLIVAGSLLCLALVAVAGSRSRRHHRERAREGAGSRRTRRISVAASLRHAARVIRRPRDLAQLMVASAGTTFLMGLAFVVSVAAVPGATPGARPGMILSAYLLGAAAGSAVPTPAGIGSTEASLVAALVVAHVPASHALASVLLFRLVTFWAPALAGLPAASVLRARAAL